MAGLYCVISYCVILKTITSNVYLAFVSFLLYLLFNATNSACGLNEIQIVTTTTK
ncbi:AAEL002584-PA [Aedes aegypti]|uniref:AAEL002584-PA n=1 Tax=Aedes aegypti TaxID=7159 RepID=Q17HS7_AEDAE|nr:AAEL002584-PA [Aedes aegypti]